jgi:hypothetical protein
VQGKEEEEEGKLIGGLEGRKRCRGGRSGRRLAAALRRRRSSGSGDGGGEERGAGDAGALRHFI